MANANSLAPKFCNKCGKKLDIMFEFTGGFDEFNGKKLYNVHVICPQYRHWWDGHKNYYERNTYSEQMVVVTLDK